MTAQTEDLIERMEAHDGSHERGCEGRNYACTCGDDVAGAKLITEAAQALRSLQAEVERLRRLVDLWVPKTTCPPSVSSSSRSALNTGSGE